MGVALGLAGGALLGGLGGLFNKSKRETVYANDYVRDAVKTGVDQSNADLGLNTGNVADYAAALKGAAPTLAGLRTSDLGNYSDLLAQSKAYDPMANYTGVGDYLFGQFGKFSKDLGAQGDAARKMNLAQRGYGNVGPSTYDTAMQTNQIARNLAPAFTSVAGMVTPGAQSVAADRYANIANEQNLMTQRAGIPTRDTTNELLPISARAAVTGDYLNNIGQAGQIAKNNIMGYATHTSDLNRFMGGMVGGLGGGSGAPADSMTLFNGNGGGGGSGGGSGGSSGGSNILGMVMKLLGMGGGGGGGSSNYTWGNGETGASKGLGGTSNFTDMASLYAGIP